jgi:hypothetical protein
MYSLYIILYFVCLCFLTFNRHKKLGNEVCFVWALLLLMLLSLEKLGENEVRL